MNLLKIFVLNAHNIAPPYFALSCKFSCIKFQKNGNFILFLCIKRKLHAIIIIQKLHLVNRFCAKNFISLKYLIKPKLFQPAPKSAHSHPVRHHMRRAVKIFQSKLIIRCAFKEIYCFCLSSNLCLFDKNL